MTIPLRPTVAIVGGGISGLALAYRLCNAATVSVLESAPRPGGNLRTEHVAGYTVEHGPNGFLDSKPSTVNLCRELGVSLVSGSEAARKNRYLLLNGRLRKLPGSLAGLAFSPLLSVRGKLALFAEPFRPPRHPDFEESVHDFFARRVGAEAADLFADAMVTGIHAGDPHRLSAASAFPRVVGMERAHGSIVRGVMASGKAKRRDANARGERPMPQRMWSPNGGLGQLIDALVAAVPVECGVEVDGIEQSRGRWQVRSLGKSFMADIVVLACPAPAQMRILRSFDADLAQETGAIRYAPVAVVALGYHEHDIPGPTPAGFGFIAPQATRADVLGVQWCSSIYPGRAPAGMVLWRALCGGWNRPEIVGLSDEAIIGGVTDVLRRAHGVTAAPRFVQVVRWPEAIPQYQLGHADRLARIDSLASQYPGLYLAGNAYRGVAINDCTEDAERLAARILAAANA